MSDIKILWDTPNGRGDWSFLPFQSNDVPVNVATPVPVGIGDGITNTFQLLTPDAQIAPISLANIYRNDWQGNQLLYATPRTNQFLQSTNLASGSWAMANIASLVATTGPDGSSNAFTLTSTSAGIGRVQQTLNVTAGVPTQISVFAQADSIASCRIVSATQAGQATFNLVGSGSTSSVSGTLSNATIINLGGGWYYCSATLTPTSTGTNVVVPVEVVAGSASVTFFGPQFGSGGSYIPTTTAPVTVTDYTLASLGLGALAAPLAIGAQLSWTGQYIDQQSSGGYLETGDDLETAILFSLFTDGEAASDDPIPDGSTDRRGWWGDDGNADGQGGTGSRLWLLARRTSPTDQTLQDAYDYIAQAIQWLVDTGVVARFDINVQWTRANMIGASIVAWPPGGGAPQTYNWAWGAN